MDTHVLHDLSRRWGIAAMTLLLLLLGAPTVGAAPAPAGGPRERVIVVFGDGVANPRATAERITAAHGGELGFVYAHALKGFSAELPSAALQGIARNPHVAYVEQDQRVEAYAQEVPTGVGRIFADGNGNIGIDGSDDTRVDVDIAIIDTGIDFEHPELNVQVGHSRDCLASSGGPPWSRTYSCVSGGDDDNGHGSHVAGSAAAIDNGAGVVGVAPGARVWAVKVLDSSGSGALGAVVAGIDYVTANAGSIEVANMSLGCECASDAMDTAIANSVAAGVTYAVAAGNADADAATHSPANHRDVITVSALADFDGEPEALALPTCRTDEDDTLANFSNYGANVEIAAPGVCIRSTIPAELDTSDGAQDGYAVYSGTSMASPHVAGAAALLASRGDPAPADIRGTLLAEGNQGWTDDSGDGVKEPLLDVSDRSVFAPATVAGSGDDGDDGGGGGGDDPSTSISLSATGSKVRGLQQVELSWNNATSTNVDVHRNGVVIATTANDGTHIDDIGQRGGGSYTYKVCEAGTSTCSNEAAVTF